MNQGEVISKTFEFAFTTGVLSVLILILLWAIRVLYNDKKELIKDLMEVSSSTLATFDKVADMKKMSERSVNYLKDIKSLVLNKQCKWISKD